MAQFAVTVGGTKYTLGTDGKVSTPAGAFGSWTTDGKSTNAIVLTPSAGGAAVSAPVTWSFNDKNQLCVSDAGGELFNFSSAQPLFRLDRANLLHVRPYSGTFEITLSCTFELTADVDLNVTIGAKLSTLKGVPASNAAQFKFKFLDRVAGVGYDLGFTGEWARDAAATTDIRMIFKGKAGGKDFTFKLPAGATLSKDNQLFIAGSKTNKAGWYVEISSTLVVRKDFTLVFTLQKQATATGEKSTEIAIATVYEPNEKAQLSTNLDLLVLDKPGPDGKRRVIKTLSLSGKGHADLGDVGMDINFAYKKTSGPGQTDVVSALVGTSFAWEDGTKTLDMTFSKEGKKTTFKLASNFVIGDDVRVQAYLNVEKDGDEKGVYGALGITF
jgi:hypothetical protein